MKKLIIISILLSTLSYSKLFDISLFKKKIIGKNITKVAKEIQKSKHIKHMPLKNISIKQTHKNLLSNVASSISKKSKFADKLIAKTAYPTDVIRQYAKYGDSYLQKLQKFNNKTNALSPTNIKQLNNLFPKMPKIDFQNSKIFNDKMVQAFKYTGKKGWEVTETLTQLAKKYPKSTIVTGLYAWYVTDPQSFFEHKDKLIKFAGEVLEEGVSDITQLTFEASSGITTGFISTLKKNMTFSNILTILLILFIFIFIFWKLRLYLKRYIKNKLQNIINQ